jgi:hypothetical protein
MGLLEKGPIIMHILLFSFDFHVPVLFIAVPLFPHDCVDLSLFFLLLPLQALPAAIMFLHFFLELLAVGLLALFVPLRVVLKVVDARGGERLMQGRQLQFLSLHSAI